MKSANCSGDASFNRVAMFIPSFGGGGAENVFVILANYWIGHGVAVDFLVSSEHGPMRSRLDKKVNVIVLKNCGSRLFRRLSYAHQIAKYCKEQSPELLMATLTYCNQVAALAKRVWGLGDTCLVIREANSLANIKQKGGRFRTWGSFWLMRHLYPAADWASANSENTLDELEAELGLSTSKRALVPNPVELHDIESDLATKQQKLILGSGRLIPQKDFSSLVHAFATVRQKHPCRLIILGEGPERGKLEALRVELGIENDAMTLPGFVDDPTEYYRKASVFVLPSMWEGLPNVVLEALSYDLPVVATDCSGGTREIFEKASDAHLVKVGDVKNMASKIEAFFEESPAVGEMQAILSERYEVGKIAECYCDLAKRKWRDEN